MKDILLEKFFDVKNWERAISDAYNKGIDKGELRLLTSPNTRLRLLNAIETNNYEIAPPHQAAIPKDNGDFRIVYVNENIDRMFLSIVNNLLFELCKDFVHKSCKSYQSGIGCGKVVKEVSRQIVNSESNIVGMKLDLTKYFDSVPIKYIDAIFEKIERKTGKSKILDIVKKYYHTDLCFDLDGNLIKHYQSLKQGCAVASFLADSILFEMDKKAFEYNEYYVRYSDDILIIGKNYMSGFYYIKMVLESMGMSLNPKKVEYVYKDRWIKFLGFNIKGNQISLSKSRLKDFQKEIEKRTIKKRNVSIKNALNSVNNYLYKGNEKYSWATSVLPIINNENDINTLNEFIMDALRACQTKKKKIGGLGSVNNIDDRTILRGIGKNVKANREKTEKKIDGYLSLGCMRNALITNRQVYETLVRNM